MNIVNRFFSVLGLLSFASIGMVEAQPNVRILPLGDSITLGCCSETSAQGGYRNTLYTSLTNAGYAVDFLGSQSDTMNPSLPDTNHQGHSNFKINDIRAGIPGWLAGYADPDVVLLHIGTNDFTDGLSTVVDVQNRLKSLVQEIYALRPYARILVSSLLPRTDIPAATVAVNAYNVALPQVVADLSASGYPVHFVDMHSTFLSADLNDGLHPKVAGYAVMAGLWQPAVTGIISPVGTSYPPAIARVLTATDLTSVILQFTKPISDASAVSGNFTIGGGVTVSGATLDASKRIVTLTTSAQNAGAPYTLSVTGVRDRTPQENLISTGIQTQFTSRSIGDPSFEANDASWTISGNAAITSASGATDGTNAVLFNGSDTTPNGLVTQAVTTVPGQVYRLSFDLGVFGAATAQALEVKVVGNVPLSPLVSQTPSKTGPGSGPASWETVSYQFTADSATTLLSFQDVSSTSTNVDLLLDHVRLTVKVTPILMVSSSPVLNSSITVSPVDLAANGDGTTNFSRIYDENTLVTLTAPAVSNLINFEKWQRDGLDYGTALNVTVPMDANHTMTAVYAMPPLSRVLDVTSTVASAVNITVSPSDTGSLGDGVTAFTRNYADNASVTLTAPETSGGFTFVKWQQNGNDLSAGLVATVTMDGNHTLNAVYAVPPISRVLDVTSTVASAVNITVSPSDTGSLGDGVTAFTRNYADNASVTLTAPETSGGFTFVKWQQNGNDLSAGLVATVTMDGNHTLNAVYAVPPVSRVLDVTSTVASAVNITVSPSDTGSLGDGVTAFTRNYADNASVTLTAPETSGGFTFVKWQQNGNDLSAGLVATVTMDGNHTLNAVYAVPPVSRVLDVTSTVASAVNITVSPSDTGSLGDGVTAFTRNYADNASVTLTAPETSGGFTFVKWQQNGNDLLAGLVATVTMDGNHTLNAVYIATNVAPVAQNDSYSTNAGVALVVAAPGVLANDTDSSPLTAIKEVNSLPANGTLTLTSGGGFTYTPNNGYTGPDSFTYTASDGSTISNVATVSITVNPVTVELIANGDFELGTPNGGGFLYNIPSWTTSGPVVFTYGEVLYSMANTGSRFLVFNDLNANPSGSISQSFPTVVGQTYQVQFFMKAVGGSTQTVRMDIDGVASIYSDTRSTSSGAWESQSQSFVATGTTATLAFTDASASSSGLDLLLDSVSVMGPGTVSRSLDVTSTVASAVNITVLPADTASQGDGVTAFTRTYADNASVTLTAPATSGGFNFVKWQKNGNDLPAGLVATVTMDGNHALNAVYVAPNVAPVAQDDSYSTNADVPLVVAAPGVLANDSDADSPSFTAIKEVNSLPANGTLTLTSGGGFTYTPNPGFTGSDSFTYMAYDGSLNSNVATVSITVISSSSIQLLSNRDFEIGTPDGIGKITPVPSWTSSGPVFGYEGASPYDANTGTRLLVFNNGSANGSGDISQSFPTVVGQTYQLEFAIKAVGASQQTVQVDIDGAASIYSGTRSAGSAAWELKSQSFVATGTSTTLKFTDVSTNSGSSDLLLDSVSVTGPGTVSRVLDVTSSVASAVNITVSPSDTTSLGDGATPFTRSYADGASVTLTAPATSGGFNFVKWQKNGNDLPAGLVATVTMDGNHTLNAVYVVPTVSRVLDVTSSVASAVNITVSPSDTASQGDGVTPLTRSYADGASVTLTAPATSGGFNFVKWQKNGNDLPAGLVATVTMDGNHTLNAVYVVPTVSRVLDVTSSVASAVNITVSPSDTASQGDGVTPLTRSYADGASVTLTAPATSGSFTFVKWQQNGNDLPAGLVATVIMDGNHTLNAVYIATNVAPVAQNDSYSTNAGVALVVAAPGVLGNDSDANSSMLTAIKEANSLPTNGTLTLTSDGGFAYTPNPGFTGPDSFTYKANDGSLDSNVATVTITVVPATSIQLLVNRDFEIGTPDGIGKITPVPSWTSSGPVFGYEGASPYDANTGTRLLVFNNGSANGSGDISQSFPTVVGQTYQLEFAIKAVGASQQTVQVDIDGAASIYSGTRSAGSAAWELKSQSFVATGTSTTLKFTDVSTNSGSSDLLLDSVSVTGPGTVSRVLDVTSSVASAVSITVSPSDTASLGNGVTAFTRNYADNASVTLTAPATSGGFNFVKWQQNGSDLLAGLVATVTMDGNHTLNAVYVAPNVAPVAQDDSYSTEAGVALVVAAPGVLANDTDSSPLTVNNLVNSLPTNGTLSLASNGGFTYTPANGFTGSDSFTYTANDGSLNSNVATVTITVVPATSIQLLVNRDFEIGTPVSRVITPVPSWTLSGPVFGYVGGQDYSIANTGSRMLVFNAGSGSTNGSGEISQSFPTVVGQTYQLEFAMKAVGAAQQTVRVDIDGVASIYSDTRSAGSAAWELKSQSFVATSTSTTLKFTDVSTNSGTSDLLLDSISVTGPGSRVLNVTSTVASAVNITVSPADLVSQANGVTAFTRSYADNVPVTLTAPATSGGFSFVKWQQNGNDLPAGLVALVTMDANHTLNAVYGANNIAPVAQNDSYSTDAGVALVVAASGILANDSDVDSPTLTAIKVANSFPANGTLSLASNGGFTYTPANGFTGTDSFTYTANDGALNSNVATVTITVSQPAVQLLINGSFESGGAPDVNGIVSVVTGWTRTGGQIGYVGTGSYTPTDPQRLILFNPGNTTVQDGTLSQSFATTPGQAYLLRYDTTAIGDGTQKLGVTVEGSGVLFSGDSGDLTGLGFGTPTWTAKSHYFVANSATTTLTLRDLSTTGTMVDLLLDNVRVTASSARGMLVTSSGASALSVTVSPSDLNASGSGVTPFGRSYLQGSSVTLTAPLTSGGLDFVKWQRNGVDLPGGRTVTVTMDANYTLNAVYIGNTAPVAVNNTYSTPEGVTLVVPGPGVLGNDTDGESNPLTAVLVAAPATGTLNLASDGSFSYIPVPSFNGTATFTYQASDGVLSSNVATVFITIGSAPPVVVLNNSFEVGTPDVNGVIGPVPSWTRSGPVVFAYVGSAPYLADVGKGANFLIFNNGQPAASGSISQQFATTPGQAYLLEFHMGVLGTPDQKVRVQLTGTNPIVSSDITKSGSTNGMASWQNKSLQFTADSALTTLTFTDVSDTAAGVDLFLDDVRVTIIGGNTAPVAVDDSYSTVQQVPLTVLAPGVLGNDSDTQADPITAVLVSGPSNGVLEGSGLNANGSFIYTPNPTFSGTDTFTYQVSDTRLNSNIVTVSINVVPGLPNILANGGFEQGSPTNFGPVTGWTQSGIYPADPGAPFAYVPDSGYSATTSDGVRLLVLNGAGGAFGGSVSQVFPTTVGQAYALDLNVGVFSGGVVGKKQALQVTVAGNSTRLSALAIGTSTAGPAQLVPRNYTFVADSSSTTITLLDASAGQSPNDASDLLVDLVRVYTIDNVRTLNVTTSASGPEVGVSPADLAGDAAGVSSFTRTYAEGAVVTLTAAQFDGANAFQKWQLNGNDITPFNPSTTVTMNANQTLNAVYVIDNTPRATADSYTTDEDLALTVLAPGLLANDFNPNSVALAAVLENAPNPAQGSLTLNANGGFVFVPAANSSGVATFTYRFSYGSSNSAPVTVTVNVNPVNDLATAGPQSVVTNEDTAVGITLVGSDADGGALSYAVVNQPTKGFLSGSAPNLTYTPNLNANGADSFTFTVNDGSGATAPATVSIAVTPVNDLPAVTARTFTMAGGTTQAIDFAGTDADNDPLTFSVASGPTNGTVTGNSPNFTYIPNPTFTGSDSFTYVANDGVANSLPATVSVSVSGILINGSFEGAVGAGNWASSGNVDFPTFSSIPIAPRDGLKCARFNSANQAPNGFITQSIATRPGFRYSVLFDLGAFAGPGTQRMTVTAVGSSSLLSQQISVSVTNTIAWAAQTLTFIANSPMTEIKFTDTSQSPSNGIDMLLDNVRVIPEAARILRVDSTPSSGVPVTTTAPADLVSGAVSGIVNSQFNRYYLLGSTPTINLAVPAVVGTNNFQKWQRNGADFAGNTTLSTSLTLSADMTMTAVYLRNQAPLAAANSYSTDEDVALVVPALTGVLANDSDPEAVALTASLVTEPTKGLLTLSPNGGFTYTPNPNSFGPDSFTYRASDGVVQSAITTVSLTVNSVNDLPNFTADPIAGTGATEDVAYVGSIAGSATDIDLGSLTYSKVSGPAWLSVAPNGVLLGTPDNGNVGTNSFVVSATDGNGGLKNAVLNIVVTNVNDAPEFTSDPVIGSNATEDQNYSSSLAGFVSDIDVGDVLTYEKLNGPEWLIVAANGALSGTPGNSDVGANAFLVRVKDSSNVMDDAALNITVVNVNDVPTFTVNSMTRGDATEDSAYNATISGSATDIDVGDAITYSKISGPSWLQVAGDGTLSGTPFNEHVGANQFVIAVTDSSSAVTQATLNISVLNVNDAPQFTADPAIVGDATEDVNNSGSLAVFVNEIDVGDVLTFSKTDGPDWLVVDSNGALSGIPTNSDVGLNTFTVSVTDGLSPVISASLRITVINANDAPVFTVSPMTRNDATEDSGYTGTIAGSASDADVGDSFTYSKISGPDWLQVAGDGTLSGTPMNENVGVNTFVVGAADGSLATGVVTLGITVVNTNDAPTFLANPTNGSNATEDTLYSGSVVGVASDVDADATLSYSDLTGPAWLTLGSGGSLSGTPSNGDVGLNVFTVKVTDGLSDPVEGTLHITVINVNDAPEFTVDPIIVAATEDVEYTSSLATLVTDIDPSETLTYTKVSGPDWLTVAQNGGFSGTPRNGDVGSNEFVVRVTDGSSVSDEAALSIAVANVNDAPTFAANPTIGTNATEEIAYTATLVGTASDLDADAMLVYSDLTGPAWLTLGSGGSLSGTPSNGDVGLNVFTVKVTDGLSDPVEGTLHITVINVNDAPEFTVDPIIVAATEDVEYTSSLATLVTDIDPSETLTYTKVSGPDWLTVAQNGGFSGTPRNGDVGSNEFVVRVTDGSSVSDEAALSITVANVNDAPTFAANPTIGTNATEEIAYTATLVGTASDLDAAPSLTYAGLNGPAWLTVASNGSLSGTPTNADVGLNVFTVSVTDGLSDPVEATLNIEVVNVNDVPVFTVNPITGTAATEDLVYSGSLVGSASDVDAAPSLTYAGLNGPAWLTVASNGSLSGTPTNADVGLNVFTVSVTDGLSDPVEATLNIEVVNVNDVPVFTVNPITGTAATEDLVYSGSLVGSASDVDAAPSLTYAGLNGPAWLTVASNGSLSGTPTNADVGLNVFTVSVTDGLSDPVEATLNIEVVNVNDVPVFTVNPITGTAATEDLVYSGSLVGSASDVDAAPSLTYAGLNGPAWLTVASNGSLSGTPTNADVGLNVFTVSVTDGLSDPVEATLNIEVVNVNDVPVFTVNPITGTAATEDLVYSGSLVGSASDVDAAPSLTYAGLNGPAWLTVASNGSLSGTPTNADVGLNVFTVSVTDGLSDPVEATLNIEVVNVNDVPVFTVNPITGTAATEDLVYSGSLVGSASDVDAAPSLTYAGLNGPAWLTVASNGSLSGTPTNADVGLNVFTVSVTDGLSNPATATLNITVINVNDTPIVNSQFISVNEDSSVNIALTGNDVDGPLPLSITSISLPANGFLSGSPPNLIYTPKPNYNGPDSFTVTMNDGVSNSAPATISITAVSVIDDNFANWLGGFGTTGNPGEDPDRDSINNAVEFVIGGNPQSRSDIDLLPTLSLVRADPDQNASQDDYLLFSYRRTALAKADEKTSIQVQWNPILTGNWTNAIGTPGVVVVEALNGGGAGVDLVNVYIPRSLSLNGKLFARLSVFINVPFANTLPVAQAQTISVNENSNRSVVLAGTDVNGQPLSYRIVTQPTKGLLSGLAPNLTYTPTPNTNGSDSFTFVANDGIADSAPATVSITVNPAHQFTQWMNTFGLVAPPHVDSDNDSISNAVEYVIGGNPANQSNSSLLPTISLATADPDNNSTNENYLLFTYRRTDLAKNDPKATIRCEWSTTLTGSWTNAVGTAGAVVVEDPNAPGANFGLVKVYIPRTYAVNGKLFGRLNVAIASP